MLLLPSLTGMKILELVEIMFFVARYFKFCIIISAIMLVGCTSGKDSQPGWKQNKILRIGTDATYPPFEMVNTESGQPEGFDIDIMKYPMLVFPTLHYQNGGIEINENGETTLPNLYAAGEQTGGLHGRNRLMGNSVLDYNVFGRRAALHAAEKSKTVKLGKLNFNHVNKYEKELKEAGIETKRIAPILLPDYRNFEVIRKHRKEFDPFLGGGVTGHYGEACDLE